MQLKVIYLLSLIVFFSSCENSSKKNEEIQVIATVYNAIPKVIPPFPASQASYYASLRTITNQGIEVCNQ